MPWSTRLHPDEAVTVDGPATIRLERGRLIVDAPRHTEIRKRPAVDEPIDLTNKRQPPESE